MFKRFGLVLPLLILLLFISSLLFSNVAFAQQGLDLNRYCKSVDKDYAALNSDTPYKWICYDTSLKERYAIPFNQVCRDQYGSNYRAYLKDDLDPYGWYCSNNQSLNPPSEGGMDLSRYCRQKINGQVSEEGSRTPFDWFCVNEDKNYNHSIDFGEVCREQYGSNYRAYLGDPFDLYTWFCSSR